MTAWAARSLPKLTGPVVDEAGLLSSADRSVISNELAHFYQTSGIQLQLVILNSLDGEAVEDFSIRLAQHWKIGRKEQDTGVMLLMAIEEKKIRIEVGGGLEGQLTDFKSGEIIRAMSPYFKKGNFSGGIQFGLVSLMDHLKGETQLVSKGEMARMAQPDQSPSKWTYLFLAFFFPVLIVVILCFGMLGATWGRVRGWPYGGSGGGAWGGGLGGGGFSSGSWSGGGGSFSGGGASGGW
ncbi:MAG: TPM domain-containing protein [Deltaproteobacteria bacterium]|nr:TPM domain-containing protein [Deltaproteobacteria bacterium]